MISKKMILNKWVERYFFPIDADENEIHERVYTYKNILQRYDVTHILELPNKDVINCYEDLKKELFDSIELKYNFYND